MKKTISSKVYQIESYERTYEVIPEYGTYQNNNSLAVSLRFKDKSQEEDDLFGTITVNLPESILVPSDAQFVDVNNYPNIGRWLKENGLANPVGLSVHSGFVTYPLYQFHLPFVRPSDSSAKVYPFNFSSSRARQVPAGPLTKIFGICTGSVILQDCATN